MNQYMIWIYSCVAAVVILIMLLHLISRYIVKNKDKVDSLSDLRRSASCLNPVCHSYTFNYDKPGVIRCYNCKTRYYDHGILGLEEYKEPSNINNPYDIQEGEYAILDEDALTAQTVRVVRISPKGIFANVTDNEHTDVWKVMCCRLSLPTYYITFGQGHEKNGVLLRDYWVEIQAHSKMEAQTKAFEVFASNWSYIYTDEEFMRSDALTYYPKGCLAKYIAPKTYTHGIK
ncbi:MAG: hypothetical protein ABIW79_07420 [Gemmatimonas sp.]